MGGVVWAAMFVGHGVFWKIDLKGFKLTCIFWVSVNVVMQIYHSFPKSWSTLER